MMENCYMRINSTFATQLFFVHPVNFLAIHVLFYNICVKAKVVCTVPQKIALETFTLSIMLMSEWNYYMLIVSIESLFFGIWFPVFHSVEFLY